jgi:hypothetical protein
MPEPFPSDVLLSEVVGFSEMPQHIPLKVTSAPPSSVIVPPDLAVVDVIRETGVVTTEGISAFFLHPLSIADAKNTKASVLKIIFILVFLLKKLLTKT